MDLTILLYQNGYPPEWDEEIFEKVMAQAENFKKFSGDPFFNQIMSYINFSRMNPYLWLQKVCRYMELRMSRIEIFVVVKKRWNGYCKCGYTWGIWNAERSFTVSCGRDSNSAERRI